MNAKQIAARFGCTVEQVKAQHAKNAAALSQMAAKARTTGKKVNGYSVEQLDKMAADALARSR